MRSKMFIFTTGGTIDKSYDEEKGEMRNAESHLSSYVLDHMRLPYTELEITQILNKDSLVMTDEDRELIKLAVEKHTKMGHPIIIVHGTDTMETTARYCHDHIKELKAPVVFTGSMVPIAFTDSDGRQNIAEAMMAAKLLDPGFYVSFHNQIFKVPNVTKLKGLRTFGELS